MEKFILGHIPDGFLLVGVHTRYTVFYYHNFQAQTILYTILKLPMIVVQSKSTKTWHHLHVNDDEKEVLSSTHE